MSKQHNVIKDIHTCNYSIKIIHNVYTKCTCSTPQAHLHLKLQQLTMTALWPPRLRWSSESQYRQCFLQWPAEWDQAASIWRRAGTLWVGWWSALQGKGERSDGYYHCWTFCACLPSTEASLLVWYPIGVKQYYSCTLEGITEHWTSVSLLAFANTCTQSL